MHSINRHFFFSLFLTLFLGSSIKAQNITPDKILDSIISSTDTISLTLKKVEVLTFNASKFRYAPFTKKLIDKAILISNEANDPLSQANADYSMGNFYYYQTKLDSSLSYLEKAQNYLKEIEENVKSKMNIERIEGSILATKAGVYNKLGAITLAISTNIEALKVLDNVNPEFINQFEGGKEVVEGERQTVYNSLANLYNKTEDFDKALFYYDKAYESAISLGKIGKVNSIIIMANKGVLFNKIEKYDDAIKILSESKDLRVKNKFPETFIASTDRSLGTSYRGKKEYDTALHHFNSAIEVYKKQNKASGLMEAYTERGFLYIETNEIDLANSDCEKAKKIALENKDAEYLMKSCECLYKTKNALKEYQSSLANLELHTAIKDSLFNEKNVRKLTQVEMQYGFDKKDAAQKLIIERKNLEKKLILIGSIALVLLALTVLFFLRKRLKYQKTIRKQEKILHKQKVNELNQENKLTAMNSMITGQELERERIAKDLHDSLGGLLSTIKAHYNAIVNNTKNAATKEQEKTSNLIDEACIEVRRISHNMMPHALSIAGLEGAISDIAENLNQQGIETIFECNQIPKLEKTKEITLYRLIQEITSNIRKHAKAKKVLIQLFSHKDKMHLTIEDDGVGFDYQTILKTSKGLGIKSIESRVAFIDGTIEWDSMPNQGTTINITAPA